VKFSPILIAACLLSARPLRAQEQGGTEASAGMTSGSDGAISCPAQLAPPTTPDEAAALDQSAYGAEEALAEAPPEPDSETRPWTTHFHASVAARYDDNIFISAAHKKSDFVTQPTAGGGMALGDYTAKQFNYLVADYTGMGEIFERHSNEDAYEQTASIEGQARLARLTLKGDFQFQDLADEDIELGARARRQIYTGDLSARYDISDKTYVEATAQNTIANYDLYLDSHDERGGLSFNYLLNPDVTIGLGAMGGVLSVQDSGSQTYEQYLSSIQIAATGKFTGKASGGLEDRQLGNGGSFVTPVFELTGGYTPFEGLDLNLTGFRRVLNSAYYTGYDYISTGMSGGIEYKFSDRIAGAFDGGYENTNYRNIATGGSISRSDNYYFVRPALRYTPSRYWNVEVYSFYRTNASTVATSSFNNTQVGASINLTY
jgi:hypothetical protein